MYLRSQSQQWKYQGNAQILFQVNEFTQVFLLLTLVVFHTLFWCFHGAWEVELTSFDVLFSILYAGEDIIKLFHNLTLLHAGYPLLDFQRERVR